MAKKRKHLIPIVATVLILAVLALIGYFPMLTMRPEETGTVPDTDILAVKCGINSIYLLPLADGFILVDTGANAKTVERALADLKIPRSSIQYILLTHSDSDHTASIGSFLNARIFIGEDELQMINGETRRNLFGHNQLPADIEPDFLAPLANNETLFLGEYSIKCLKTPGHTPGSVSYLIDEKYLFTGDAFRVRGSEILLHPYSMDSAVAHNSIRQLLSEGDDDLLVFTAHYGVHQMRQLDCHE